MDLMPSNIIPSIIETTYGQSLAFLDRVSFFNKFFEIIKAKHDLENYISEQYQKIQAKITKLLKQKLEFKCDTNTKFVLQMLEGFKQIFKVQESQAFNISANLKTDILNPFENLVNQQSDINQSYLSLSREYNTILNENVLDLEKSKQNYIHSYEDQNVQNQEFNLYYVQNSLDKYNCYIGKYRQQIQKIDESHENFQKTQIEMFHDVTLKMMMFQISSIKNIQYDTDAIFAQMKYCQDSYIASQNYNMDHLLQNLEDDRSNMSTKNITNEEKSFMSMAANFHNPQSQDMENVIIKLSEINFGPYIQLLDRQAFDYKNAQKPQSSFFSFKKPKPQPLSQQQCWQSFYQSQNQIINTYTPKFDLNQFNFDRNIKQYFKDNQFDIKTIISDTYFIWHFCRSQNKKLFKQNKLKIFRLISCFFSILQKIYIFEMKEIIYLSEFIKTRNFSELITLDY